MRGIAGGRVVVIAMLWLCALMAPEVASALTPDADFAARCDGAPQDGSGPGTGSKGVLRCFSFDSASQLPSSFGGPGTNRNYGKDFGVMAASGTPVIDTVTKASGAGSMRMQNTVGGGSDGFGSWFTHFGVNKTHQLNQGDTVFVQYRVRYDPEMLVASNWQGADGGFKVSDLSLGDLPSCNPNAPDSVNCPTSCPNQGAEWVTQQHHTGNLPIQNYANCSGNVAFQGMYGPSSSGNPMIQNATGCFYPNFPEPPCVYPKANEWMTFKQQITMGTFNSFSTTLRTWIGREGQPLRLVVDCSPTAATKCVNPSNGAAVNGWWLENSGGADYKMGKVYLHPYMTRLSNALVAKGAWYDELIIATQDIADPGAAGSPGVAPAAPCCLRLTELGPVTIIAGAIMLGGRWRRRVTPGRGGDRPAF